MNSEGPVCWRGVASSPGGQLSCTCRTDPPEFDIVFPADASFEVSTTVAPATTTDNGGYLYYTLTNIGTEFISANGSGGGIGGVGGDGGVGGGGDDGGGGGGVATFRPITVSPTDQDGNSSQLWIETHEGSLKLLIWAFLALLCIVVFLILLIVCFVKRRRKRSPVNSYQPQATGCETNEQPCEVKTTVPTSATNHVNNFQLVELDESPIHRTIVNDTRHANSHGAPSGSANHSAAAGYPMMRAVKAKIVGSGISPIRTIRPVGRQDSTKPLVEHHDDDDGVLFRDGWADFGDDHAHHSQPFTPQFGVDHDVERNPSLKRQLTEINPSWRPSEVPILTPLGEPGDRTSKEVTTKLEILPCRLFPEPSVLETTPCRKKTNKRPDSSTPLFDGDSLSSVEMDNH